MRLLVLLIMMGAAASTSLRSSAVNRAARRTAFAEWEPDTAAKKSPLQKVNAQRSTIRQHAQHFHYNGGMTPWGLKLAIGVAPFLISGVRFAVTTKGPPKPTDKKKPLKGPVVFELQTDAAALATAIALALAPSRGPDNDRDVTHFRGSLVMCAAPFLLQGIRFAVRMQHKADGTPAEAPAAGGASKKALRGPVVEVQMDYAAAFMTAMLLAVAPWRGLENINDMKSLRAGLAGMGSAAATAHSLRSVSGTSSGPAQFAAPHSPKARGQVTAEEFLAVAPSRKPPKVVKRSEYSTDAVWDRMFSDRQPPGPPKR